MTLRDQSLDFALYDESEADGARDPYPICRAESTEEALVANEQGLYMVGDSVYRLKTYTDYGQARRGQTGISHHTFYPKEQGQTFRTNTPAGSNSNRKCEATFFADPSTQTFKVSVIGKKKVGFIVRWWIKYATTYQMRLYIRELTQPLYFDPSEDRYYDYRRLLTHGGTEYRSLSGQQLLPDEAKGNIIEISTSDRYETGDDTFVLAHIRPMRDSLDLDYGRNVAIRGRIEFWSRGVSYGEQIGRDELNVGYPLSANF